MSPPFTSTKCHSKHLRDATSTNFDLFLLILHSQFKPSKNAYRSMERHKVEDSTAKKITKY